MKLSQVGERLAGEARPLRDTRRLRCQGLVRKECSAVHGGMRPAHGAPCLRRGDGGLDVPELEVAVDFACRLAELA